MLHYHQQSTMVPFWQEDGSVHRLHKFRTQLLSTEEMHKTLHLLCWRTLLRLEVSCGKWKDDRTAVFIEVVVSDGKKEKVCMIYISSHKDGKARWIMINCAQAKNWNGRQLLQISECTSASWHNLRSTPSHLMSKVTHQTWTRLMIQGAQVPILQKMWTETSTSGKTTWVTE